MIIWDWVKIIAKILELIAEGMSRSEAVGTASMMFGVDVDVDDIWRHGGF